MFTKLQHSAKAFIERVGLKRYGSSQQQQQQHPEPQSPVKKMAKKLAAFDFDHTIVDENSDLVAKHLLGSIKVPESVKELYKLDGWTSYMQGIFDLLYINKIKEETIMKNITTMKEVTGMKNLITTLVDKHNFDVIVISDSNSVFINEWLKANNLDSYIHTVFTNPARFLNGHLYIKMYHLQDTCNLSTKNLCKGSILEEFCKDKNYEQVYYVGDGKNDFCPILKLSENDVACVRRGYKCAELVKACQSKTPIDNSGTVYEISAKICMWREGNDILKSVSSG